MKKIAKYTIIFLIILSGACTVESTNNPEQADITAIATEYFNALHTLEFDRVRELTVADMQFSDPTAEGQPTVITSASREEFLAYMEANSDGAGKAAVTDSFKTGKYVTLYVNYQGNVDGKAMGAPGKTLSFNVDGVTIITIENNKVTHHLDYVDYESLFQQLADAANDAP